MYVYMCVTDFSENDVSLCILNFIIFKRFLENKLKQELFFWFECSFPTVFKKGSPPY